MSTDLPYRTNVGAALFKQDGRVFIGRRADAPADQADAWQMPQGGIDPGEDPAQAVMRELREEIGTARAVILAEHPDWLTYDLPAHRIATAFGGKYRGQRQKWFALRFEGSDADIDLNHEAKPEFSAWRWAPLSEVAGLVVPFKRAIYETLARDFGAFAISPKPVNLSSM